MPIDPSPTDPRPAAGGSSATGRTAVGGRTAAAGRTPAGGRTAAAGAAAAAAGRTAAELPVLDEVPELASALEVARSIDRMTAQLIEHLMLLQEHALAERVTGVALEQWLAIVGRRTDADRRMLLTACDVFRRLPCLYNAFVVNGTVSWAQTRTIVLKVCRLPRRLDEQLEAELGRIIMGSAGADPDAVGSAVNWLISSLDPGTQASEQQDAERMQFFAMQPRLDGSGGRVWGEFGSTGFAILDAALNAEADPAPGTARDGFGTTPDRDRARELAAISGADRAQRLLGLVDHDCADPGPENSTVAGAAAHTGAAGRAGRRPQLLIRVGLDSLLDREQVPAQLLTTLTGGRLWADAATVRRLVEQRGADLRAVVLDDTGQVVGVGRRTRVAPAWLADATLAVHDTCTAPGCRTASRVCDIDHARPWHPVHDRARGGTTDLVNLAPVCASDNRSKESDGWTAVQHVDGSRTWHHPRTGLTTRSLPATWRPPEQIPDRGREAASHPAPGPTTRPPPSRARRSELERRLHALLGPPAD